MNVIRVVQFKTRPVTIGLSLFLCAAVSMLVSGCDNDRASNEAKTEKKHSKAKSAPADPPPPPSECRWAESVINIDGVSDELDWKNAQVIENFYLPWLKDKARPSRTKTSAKLLWDRENLYFFAEMEDTDLYADVTERDGPAWNNDVFELFFKPADDKPGYYEIEVSPANTILDMFLPRRDTGGYGRFKSERPFEMKTAVKLKGTLNKWEDKDQGWCVEGKIPWRDFLPTGGRPVIDEIWKFALCRVDISVDVEGQELSTNAPLNSLHYANFHRYEDYAKLKFVGAPAKSAVRAYGIEKRIAWNDSNVTGSPEPALPFRPVKAFENLNVPCPMHVYHEPGTENLLLLHQLAPWGGAGRILRIKDDKNVSDFQVLAAPDRIFYGLAFDPDYATNGYLYAGSNGPMTTAPKTTRVSRFTVDRKAPFAIDPKSEFIVIEWESDGHNGGDLAFGIDGMLYISSGDGTSDSDKNLAGQDLTKLTSKVLRLDISRGEPGKPYVVPPDNPFVGKANARPETWAYGLRNPWRLTVDRQTGHVWVGNNGQDLWEQVYFIKKGENYGWSVMEGGNPFYPDRQRGPDPIVKPAIDHPHSEARSLTGGQVYYGSAFPELRGRYIYGDWSTGKVWAMKHDGQRVTEHREIASTTLRITGFGFDSKGELLIADHGGGYYHLERTPDTKPRPFPTRLSETGVFSSVKNHAMHAAGIAYSVNAQLWSDGAYKERFFLLPGADSKVNYTTDRGWEFPEGSVLVKSFGIEREQGNSQSRQWVETRLLTKQLGQWLGYSYEWNAEQTDATLVGKEGVDRDFSVRDSATSGGAKKQTWHYPSRTECMVCHSRAFNFVLGLSELQLNKTHDYGGVVDNQLRTLEHLGIFKVKWKDQERGAIWREARAKGKSEKEAGEFADKLCATRLQREPVDSSILYKTPELCEKLTDPYDEKADLNQRARSYLHANCAQCHVEAGGGNAMMELEFKKSPDQMRIFDVKPLHHTFDKAEARLIAPGDPARSMIFHRMSMRGAGQMPPLATSMVDQKAVKLMREWITQLDSKAKR